MTDIAIRFTTSGQEVVIGALRQVGASAVSFLGDAARAFAELGKESVTVAADYQSTLNNFAAVTGKAMETAGLSTQEFSKLFLDLGAKTQFSAGQAAEAAVELAKGGVAVADIYGGALDAALGLAAAGSLDLANAAEIMAKQLGVWGDTGVTATEITDLLAQAANASTVDVDNLAQGLAQVGGAAKIAGVEFPDLVQTMAMLAPGFASASDAGTSLKTFLQRMVPSTKEATKEMIALGLATENGSSKFFDSEGAFIGMGAAAELLKGATKDLSEEQRLAAFSTIFGSDALRAASMIAENGAAGFSEMGNAMTEAGTAAEQAALRNQGFNFAMESLKGSVETAQIVLASTFLPALEGVINSGLIPITNAIVGFFQAIADGEDVIGPNGALVKFTRSLGDIIGRDAAAAVYNLIGGFIDAGTRIQKFFDLVGNGVSPVGALWATLHDIVPKEAFQFLFDLQPKIAGFFEFMEKKFGLFTFWLKAGKTPFEAFIITLRGLVPEDVLLGLQNFVAWLAGAIPQAIGFVQAAFQSVTTWIGGIVTQIAGFVQSAMSSGDPLKFFADAILGMIPPEVLALFDNLKAAVARLQEAWAENGGLIMADAQRLLQVVGAVLAGIAVFITTVVIPAFVSLVAWVVENWPLISATVQKMIDNFLGPVQTNLAQIQEFWEVWGGKIIAVFEFIKTEAKRIFDTFSKLFKGDWEGFGNDLKAAWDTVWTSIKLIISTAIDEIKKIDWASIGTSILAGIATGITNATTGLINAAVAAARAAVEAVQNFLGIQSPSKVFAGIGANMMLGMGAGITSTAGVPAAAAAGAASYATQVSVGAVNVYSQPGQSETAIAQEVRRQLDEYARRGDTRARL